MSIEHVITDAARIALVLQSDLVAPPVRDGDGPTLGLRNEMARFAGPTEHAERRRAVVAAIAALDADCLTGFATEDDAQLTGDAIDAIAIARSVPLAALVVALGLAAPDDHQSLAAIAGDVEAVVAVIGRGLPATDADDDATRRLAARTEVHPLGSVAVLSILYQSVDATAGLIATMLHVASTDAPRMAAVPRTKRVALTNGTIVGIAVEPATELTLEIGAAGLEFGAGPHACPGQLIAERIATSVVQAIDAAGFVVDLDTIALDADGRPTALLLRRRSAR